MKLKSIFYIMLILALISACSDKSKDNHEPKTGLPFEQMVIPYAVEYYEFQATEIDTFLLVYLNRSLKTKEYPNVRIDLFNDDQYAYGLLPFKEEKMTNNILRIDLPIRDEDLIANFPDFAKNGNFMQMLRNHLGGLSTIKMVHLRMGSSNVPVNGFLGNQKLYWIEDALSFEPSDTIQIKTDRFKSIMPWRKSLFKNYKGLWDKQNNKNGIWEWYYSNGIKMAEAEFFHDSLISPFKFYYYSGELQDSITYTYLNGKKFESHQTFFKNGQLKKDDNYRYTSEYDIAGELINHSDSRNCDSVDLSKFTNLAIKTKDGRDFIYKDSLEKLTFTPDITSIQNCFFASTGNGCYSTNFFKFSKGDTFEIKACTDVPIEITFKISNIDTTIESSLIINVKER